MLQAGRGPDLRHEPLRAEDGGELGLQDLEGDFAIVPAMERRFTRPAAFATAAALPG